MKTASLCIQKVNVVLSGTLSHMIISDASFNYFNNLYIIIIIGPMPLYFCRFNMYLKAVIMMQNILFFDAMIISKYVLIFHVKNPAAFQDDFWSRFATIWIVIFSFVTQLVSDMIPSKNTLYFYIWTGKIIIDAQ